MMMFQTQPSLKRTIQRERRRHLPAAPKTVEEIKLEGHWRETHAGEDWVIFEEMTDDGKILMFSTAENLQKLSSSSAWFGDGTFSVTPPLFYQFFTIFAIFSTKQCLLYIACSQRNQNLCMCRLSKKFELITDKFHKIRYEHLWNHDFYAQESNIIFDLFFDLFFDVFDVFYRLKVNSVFCLIRCVDV